MEQKTKIKICYTIMILSLMFISYQFGEMDCYKLQGEWFCE